MAGRISRRKIASYYADELLAGKKDIATQLAAFLIDTRRQRELDLIVRDIELALADRGVLVADVASSRDLSQAAKKSITDFLQVSQGARTVTLREHVDATLLGGVRIGIPGAAVDATLRRKLNLLKSTKV